MENKRQSINRDSSGSTEIGTEEDGAIMEMYEIGGRLLIIKEKSVYEHIMADQIDPQRENPDLHNTQKLILPLGTDSEMFSRTFLLTKQLLKPEFLLDTIDVNKGILLSLEIIQELSAMDKEILELLNAEKKACEDYYDRKNKRLDHAVPSITNIKTGCNTIFQKANQILKIQMDLIRLFYPDFERSYYTKFLEFIEQKYGTKHNFPAFLRKVLPSIELLINIRNCLEHNNKEIQILDFELQISGDIISPTIEIEYNNSKLNRTSLTSHLEETREGLVAIYESLVAYLCQNNIKTKGIPSKLLPIPADRRVNKFVKFGYWSSIGNEGFFYQ